MDVKEIRVANAYLLASVFGRKWLIGKLGYKDRNYLNQLCRGHGSFGNRTARRFETSLGLERGWMDRLHHPSDTLSEIDFSRWEGEEMDLFVPHYPDDVSSEDLTRIGIPVDEKEIIDGKVTAMKLPRRIVQRNEEDSSSDAQEEGVIPIVVETEEGQQAPLKFLANTDSGGELVDLAKEDLKKPLKDFDIRSLRIAPLRKPITTTGQSENDSRQDHDYDIVYLPKHPVELAAGDGTTVSIESDDGRPLSFRRDYLNRKGWPIKDLYIVYIRGDSMAPMLRDGSVVVVNTADREVYDGVIYAIRYGDELRCKQLFKSANGRLTIHSLDGRPDEHYTPDEANELEVIGRVVWGGGEFN